MDKLPTPHAKYCLKASRDDEADALPLNVLESIGKGKAYVVRSYLELGGNVNALYGNESLLSRACVEGKTDVVMELLENLDIDVNHAYQEQTPMGRAAQHEHVGCVRLILDSQLKPNLENDWEAVAMCLKRQPELKYPSVVHILRRAANAFRWDVVLLLLEMDHPFQFFDLNSVYYMALIHEKWDVLFSVLDKEFFCIVPILHEVFKKGVSCGNWENTQRVLHMINKELSFDEAFANAIVSKNTQEVEQLLSDKDFPPEMQNGNLLVATAAGASGTIFKLLMDIKMVYNQQTFASSLVLAALSHSVELFSVLLKNDEAQYSLKDMNDVKSSLERVMHPVTEDEDKCPLLNDLTQYIQNMEASKSSSAAEKEESKASLSSMTSCQTGESSKSSSMSFDQSESLKSSSSMTSGQKEVLLKSPLKSSSSLLTGQNEESLKSPLKSSSSLTAGQNEDSSKSLKSPPRSSTVQEEVESSSSTFPLSSKVRKTSKSTSSSSLPSEDTSSSS